MKTISLVSENGIAKKIYKLDRWEALCDAGECGDVDLQSLLLLYRLFCGADPSAGSEEEYKASAVAMVIGAILNEHLGVSVETLCAMDPLAFINAS